MAVKKFEAVARRLVKRLADLALGPLGPPGRPEALHLLQRPSTRTMTCPKTR